MGEHADMLAKSDREKLRRKKRNLRLKERRKLRESIGVPPNGV